MAGIDSTLSILKAIGRCAWRDFKSLRSVTGQNLLFFTLVIAYQQLQSAAFLVVILAAVMLFPLSTDPLQRVPPERRRSWPVAAWEWAAIGIAGFALAPVTWVAALVVWKAGWQIGLFAFAAALSVALVKYAAARLGKSISGLWLREIDGPPGITGYLMRLQWREMSRTLDVYAALILTLCTGLFRLFDKNLDPDAPRIMSLMLVLILSTQAQVSLGLDGKGAERYRHWPIRGWQILLAKDLAFLTVLALLVLPLAPLPGLVSGLVVLAIGHHRAVLNPIPQAAWRFTSGAVFPDGLIQMIALFSVGMSVHSGREPVVALCVLAWLLSMVFYGRQWDRQAQLT